MPCSGDPNIKSLVDSSNIGKPGVWLFRIDQSAIQSCPNKVTCDRDELCSCLQDNSHPSCLCKNTITNNCRNEELVCLDDDPLVTSSKPVPTAIQPPEGDTPNNQRTVVIVVPLVLVVVLILLFAICGVNFKILKDGQPNAQGDEADRPPNEQEDEADGPPNQQGDE
ncbi:hypothetical protein GBAR_LOCUS30618, partial [Geodia barretti]